jgi:hypothetical protein
LGTRKRKPLYAKTRKEAAYKLAEAMGEAARGIYYYDEHTTVTDWMDR